ncbi:putative E3 ubiquitin-protein ligase ARI13 [Raphanus sativus]|uniref:RBR-type E3 ubiquitin transferase n=1 Tax=Raphanus sativus TaxID=3726 RepID=A0A6J0NZW1_RAPSA|nr:probable E3 ubiquitin-protein ligase ARI13 [Raphanus sativus]KAJ4897336.1 putative E3 ubiquitin-protein ligase ARI13 [Raphanus sativus]
MEDDDLQRPYSVCTRDYLKEKMNKQINDISEIFCVSNSDATVLLMKLRWNSQLLSERLCQENKKLLSESGLKPVVTDTKKDLSDSSCDEFYEFFDDVNDDDDVKTSTPFCSHKFSTTYWSKYLEKNFFSVKKTLATISCPHQDCGAAVGRDTIEKLTVKDKDRYDEYILRSYLGKRKRQIKQCPAQGCSYFIEFPRSVDAEEYGLNVVCLCGHTFCWRCRLESHGPVTCKNASDWLSRDLEKLSKSLSVSWIEANRKPCPHCLSPVEIGLGSLDSKFESCAYCSGSFCWECMQSEESHKTESGSYDGDCLESETEEDPPEVDTSCLDRWEASEVSLVEAKSELQAFEESNSTKEEEYVKVTREGLMLIVQCRQFLKWSCVYEHIHLEHEASKKEFLRFLQDYASTLVQSFSETLKEETRKALSEPTSFEEVTCYRGNISAVTSSIGNYFYNFSKALRDGLDVVEVKHYDDFSPCWLCDRCTYANTWLHKACQMCCDESAVEKPK